MGTKKGREDRKAAGAHGKKTDHRSRLTGRIPRHPDMESLMPYLGPCSEPKNEAEALIEYVDGEFMLGGFNGFEAGVLRVSQLFNEYNIDRNSETAKQVLAEYIEHVLAEYYGDFERWTTCEKCKKDFQPVYSIEYANRIINDGVFCPECIK